MAKGEDVFKVEFISKLIDLMDERGLSEVDLKQGEHQIRLVRQASAQASATPLVQAANPAPADAVVAAPAQEADGPHIKLISAPMVGTFYNKPNPNAESFVKVGSRVSADTVVCIVEAMKVFNEIPAEVEGTIVAILADNEEAVDFGRPLFKVDTRG